MLKRAFVGLALAGLLAISPVAARVDAALERQVGGVYSNACGDRTQPMVRLYGDTMAVERSGKTVAARRFRALQKSPVSPPPADFKVALEGEVAGGDGLVFVLTHNAQGLYLTLVGGAKSLAALGPDVLGQRLRHCDPNRNALPGASVATGPAGPNTLLADPKFKALYLKALGPLARERWLARLDGPAPPTRTVKVVGRDYTLAAACKPHDCADNNVVVLYHEGEGVVYAQVHQRGQSVTLGGPPSLVALELGRLWKAEWRAVNR
jgi:hypothetical protein